MLVISGKLQSTQNQLQRPNEGSQGMSYNKVAIATSEIHTCDAHDILFLAIGCGTLYETLLLYKFENNYLNLSNLSKPENT